MLTLEHLLCPMDRTEFFDYYLRQVPLIIRHASPTLHCELVSVDEISEIVQQGIHPEGRFRVLQGCEDVPFERYCTKDSRPRLDPSRLRRLLDGGASLVLNGIDELHAKIGDLAHAMELDFCSDVWANAYLTVNEAAAFNTHFDDHDVIVLQVIGSKRWRLFGKTDEFPLHPGKSLGMVPTTEREGHLLSAGDVLFVPRGEWHRTEVADSPSLHLTFGIGGVTGLDMVRSCFAQLSEQAVFRQYLPRAGGEEMLRDHEKVLKSQLHALVSSLSIEEFVAEMDGARRSRSKVMIMGDVELAARTKVRIALRRMPSEQITAELGRKPVQVGGQAFEFGPIEALITRIVGKRIAMQFAELVEEVRASGGGISEMEISCAVKRLIGNGVLNAEA